MVTCPNCEALVQRSDLRYEDEPRTWDYPGSYTQGCKHCLSGKHVHYYRDHFEALRDDAIERRLDAMREGCDL